MKKTVKRLLAVLCGMAVLCGGAGMSARAEEAMEVQVVDEYQELSGDNVGHGIYDIGGNANARAAMLAHCSLSISVSADGVRGCITTGSTEKASVLGVSNIRLEKYVDGKWTLVAEHPGGYTRNDNMYVMSVSTGSAVRGVKYRLTCTHYADLSDGRHEMNNATNGVSYER